MVRRVRGCLTIHFPTRQKVAHRPATVCVDEAAGFGDGVGESDAPTGRSNCRRRVHAHRLEERRADRPEHTLSRRRGGHNLDRTVVPMARLARSRHLRRPLGSLPARTQLLMAAQHHPKASTSALHVCRAGGGHDQLRTKRLQSERIINRGANSAEDAGEVGSRFHRSRRRALTGHGDEGRCIAR